jgi:hypothetical protein
LPKRGKAVLWIRLNSWGFFSRTFRSPLNNNINSSLERLWIIIAE